MMCTECMYQTSSFPHSLLSFSLCLYFSLPSLSLSTSHGKSGTSELCLGRLDEKLHPELKELLLLGLHRIFIGLPEPVDELDVTHRRLEVPERK